MGNMCLDLCKEISSSDRKARLTKELQDIYPIDDGSLKIHANGSVVYSRDRDGTLLHETRRLNGEVTYTYSGELDDDSISELNELIREVSLEETNDEHMSRSSTSLEISTLIADLEHHKYLTSDRDDSLCGKCETPKLSRHDLPRHSSPYSLSRRSSMRSQSDYNNNVTSEDEVSYLLKMLEKDSVLGDNQEDVKTSERINHVIENEVRHFTDTSVKTDTTKFDIKETIAICSNQESIKTIVSSTNHRTHNESSNEKRIATPDFDLHQSTVIDTYLKDINETFSKEDEIAYLLSLLGNDEKPYNKDEGNVSSESIMHEDYSTDTKINVTCANVTPTTNDLNTSRNREPVAKGPVIRKISPIFAIQDEFIIPARKKNKDITNYNNNNTNTNAENMDTVVNAMDFVCQLICANRPSYPVNKTITRPCPPSPKKIEIQQLLTKLEHDKTEDNQRKETNTSTKKDKDNSVKENKTKKSCNLPCVDSKSKTKERQKKVQNKSKHNSHSNNSLTNKPHSNDSRSQNSRSNNPHPNDSRSNNSRSNNLLPNNSLPNNPHSNDSRSNSSRTNNPHSNDSRSNNLRSSNSLPINPHSNDSRSNNSRLKNSLPNNSLPNNPRSNNSRSTKSLQNNPHSSDSRSNNSFSNNSKSSNSHPYNSHPKKSTSNNSSSINSLSNNSHSNNSHPYNSHSNNSQKTNSRSNNPHPNNPRSNYPLPNNSHSNNPHSNNSQLHNSHSNNPLSDNSRSKPVVNNQPERGKVSTSQSNAMQTELQNIIHDMTLSDEPDGIDVDMNITKELEIESLLSKLGKVQLTRDSESAKVTSNCEMGTEHDQNHYRKKIPNNQLNSHFISNSNNITNKQSSGKDSTQVTEPYKKTNKFQSGDDDIPFLLSLLDDNKESRDYVDAGITSPRDCISPKYIEGKTVDTVNGYCIKNETNLLEKCKSFDLDMKENTPKNGIVTEELDMSEISVTYRRIKKSIVLNEDDFSEETRSIKDELHFYTRGLRSRSLSPCYEHDEEFNPDILSLDQLIEQLSAFESSTKSR